MMNRKNTILLAVLVNAGLLVVLFVTALTSQEEIAIPPTHEVAGSSSSQQPAPPLFGDEIDFTLRQSVPIQPSSPLPQVVPETSAHARPEDLSTVHSLPPLQPEVVPVAAIPNRPESSLLEVTVKKGDTLEKIAKANHATVDEIIKINQLPSSFLRIGQKLKMPGEKTLAQKAAKPASAEKKPVEVGPDYYTVKVGDNAWTIAMKNHLKVDELLKLNSLNEEKARKLKPGDRLRIR